MCLVGLNAIASIGTLTAKTILAYFDDRAGQSLFESADQDALKTLADALKAWDDGEAAKLVQAVGKRLAIALNVNNWSRFLSSPGSSEQAKWLITRAGLARFAKLTRSSFEKPKRDIPVSTWSA